MTCHQHFHLMSFAASLQVESSVCLVAVFVPQQVEVLFPISSDQHLNRSDTSGASDSSDLGTGSLDAVPMSLKWITPHSLAARPLRTRLFEDV